MSANPCLPADWSPCPWCGGQADPGTTCPRSIDCPSCGASAGHPCRRPSGHRADTLHAERVRLAEELDARRPMPGQQTFELLDDPADHECDCMCSGCTDLWRPEDASEAILEAERWAAEHEKDRPLDDPRYRLGAH